MESTKPRVLVLGSTGVTGRKIAARLDDASDRVEVVRLSRNPETVARFIRATGTLMADDQADVAAETAGRIVGAPVERGTPVATGPRSQVASITQ